MLREGEYIIWFRTPLGSGTGRILLKEGKISGSDSAIAYSGSYSIEGERFTAKLTTRRYAPGHESLVGADEVELSLDGMSKGDFACCSGSTVSPPYIKVDITLIPMRSQDIKPRVVYRAEAFHPERLPGAKTRR
jgi:hypothetical protein